jgi:serine/threonine-protein kinase HipA
MADWWAIWLDDTMEKARNLWPDGIKDLPMNEDHKKQIKEHWSKLEADFKIG